jgi:hypothetical protein
MRLSWPFGRTPDPGEGSGDAPALPVAPPGPGPAGRGAWASLPPIQRSIGAAPLIAPADAFLAGVPGARPLPPIVQSLGHDVSPLASGGLVAATVHATPSLTSHAALIPPPVQRRADPSAATWASPVADPVVTEIAPTPDRTLAVVTPEATVRPPSRPLTRADAFVASGPAAAPAVASSAGVRPLVSRRTQVSSGTAPAIATTSAPSPTPPTVSRTTASSPLSHAPGLGRRSGLGAPLSTTPPTAVGAEVAQAFPAPVLAQLAASRAASHNPDPGSGAALDLASVQRATRPTAGAAPLRTTIQRRTAGATSADAQVDDDRDEVEMAAPDLPLVAADGGGRLPVLRVVGGSQTGSSASGAATLQRATSSASGAGSAPEATATVVFAAPSAPIAPLRRPLMGSRPIQTSVQTSRADETSEDDGDSGDATGGGSPLRLVPAGSEGPSGGPIGVLPSIGGSSTAPARGGQPSSNIQRQAAEPLLARRPAVAVGGSGSAAPVGIGSPSWSVAAAAPAMSLARAVSPSVTAAPVAVSAPPTVSRSIVAAPADPAPTVQTTRNGGGASNASTPFGPTATPIVQRIDGAAPTTPTPDTGHSDHELDELAKAIFGRLRNRLRSEYIHEREAKGLTFDNS